MDLKNLFGYEGKTVVVSGAYSGMGLAAARLLQELGGKCLNDLPPQRAAQ